MFTAGQIVAHLVGDYILQSDWMATRKHHVDGKFATTVHCIVYTLPFLVLTLNPFALFFIAATHYFIDHYKLAKYVVWGKNILGPKHFRYSLNEMRGDGFSESNGPPHHIGNWIYIIIDNTMHILCNGFAISVIAATLIL